MEEKIFPLPAVAGILKEQFIEARLHTDGGVAQKRNQDLQKELTGSVATPIYVVVDPMTGRKLRTRAGLMKPEVFIEFLRGKALR